MRQILLLLALLPSLTAAAQRTKTVSLDYAVQDFNVSLDDARNTVITSERYILHFRKEQDAPALPCIGVNVLIGRDEDLAGFSISFSEVKLGSRMKMKGNPQAVRAGEKTASRVIVQPAFTNAVYPDTIVKFIGSCCRDGYRYLVFNVCPFAYVPDGGSLLLRHHIEMDIQLTPSSRTEPFGPYVGRNMRDIVRQMVVNPEELPTLYPERRKAPLRAPSTVVPSIAGTDAYEYLIITTNAFKSQFQRLADWKTTKGVRTKVLTREEIIASYSVPAEYPVSETNMQIVYKIKAAIQDYYENHGVRYVLLGARSYIPYFRADALSEGTDWFYACITGGSWNWGYDSKTRRANLIGIEDMVPDVYVTRALVVDTTEAGNFVNRVIEYESATHPEEWDYRALFWGGKILRDYHFASGTKSDSQHNGDWIYWSAFSNVYDCDKLYDTYSNMGFPLTQANLSGALDDGYEFVHFSTYMYPQGQLRLTPSESFTFSNAQAMSSQHYTLMTSATESVVSLTDNSYAEKFMNNPGNNVIAFLGSNCWSLHSSDSTRFLHTDLYMEDFYDRLFNGGQCHFGEAATLAKSVFEPDEYDQFNDTWLLTDITPVGDCEMPVFLPNTWAFGDGTGPMMDRVTITYSNGVLHVDTPDNCRICVMSKADHGAAYYAVIDSVSGADFAPPLVECTVAVTNICYKPFVKTIFSPVYVQDETLTGSRDIVGEKVFMGYDVTTGKAYGPVVVQSGETAVHAPQVTIKNSFKVNLGAKFKITNN